MCARIHYECGSQCRQRHITPHTELKVHNQLTPMVKKLIGSIYTRNKGLIYCCVPKNASPAAELHILLSISQAWEESAHHLVSAVFIHMKWLWGSVWAHILSNQRDFLMMTCWHCNAVWKFRHSQMFFFEWPLFTEVHFMHLKSVEGWHIKTGPPALMYIKWTHIWVMACSLWFTAAVSKWSRLRFHITLTMTSPSTHSQEKWTHHCSINFENETQANKQ